MTVSAVGNDFKMFCSVVSVSTLINTNDLIDILKYYSMSCAFLIYIKRWVEAKMKQTIFSINFRLRHFVVKVINKRSFFICSVIWVTCYDVYEHYSNLMSEQLLPKTADDGSGLFIESLLLSAAAGVQIQTSTVSLHNQRCVFTTSVPCGVRPLARIWLSMESVLTTNHRLHHGSRWFEKLCLVVL